ncbi:hypothetical protein, partial [Bacillus altitudinis]
PVCLAVSLALASGLVQAQQSDEGIEIIEVTAQKRAENMQEVPIAITAFSADTIDKMGLKNINDLGLITPGLETNNATA